MTRRERRLAVRHAKQRAGTVEVRIERLTIEGCSPHVARRIGDRLGAGLVEAITAAPERVVRETPAEGLKDVSIGPHDLPERIGDALAAVVAGQLLS